MTTYAYTSVFQNGGAGQNGVVVDAWDVSRFGSAPAFNASTPSGSADATATTANTFGQPGAFTVQLPSTDEFYLSAVFGGARYWFGPVQGVGAAGGGGVESVVAGTDIDVDDTDPANPVVSATGGGSGASGDAPFAMVEYDPVDWAFVNASGGTPGIPSYTYANGTDGVGATMTATANGVLATDGGAPIVGDRVAVSDFDAPAHSGLYTVTSVGSVSTHWVLTRSTDADTAETLSAFWVVAIGDAGTVYGGGWAANWGDTAQRSGFTVGTDQLGVSVGNFLQSFAAGPGAIAAGPGATAVGALASALGAAANALGTQSTAVQDNDTAVGVNATASGGGATAVGDGAGASGSNAVAVGNGAQATGPGSTAVGLGAVAGGDNAAVLGQGIASGDNSTALGMAAVAYSPNQVARQTNNGGYNQVSEFQTVATTADATPTSASVAFVMQDLSGDPAFDRTYLVRGRVVARRTDTPGTDSAWVFADGVLRGDGAGAYSWVGGTAPAPAVGYPVQDVGAVTWDVSFDIADTNTVVFTVTGEAATTIAWLCVLELYEAQG